MCKVKTCLVSACQTLRLTGIPYNKVSDPVGPVSSTQTYLVTRTSVPPTPPPPPAPDNSSTCKTTSCVDFTYLGSFLVITHQVN